jgi:hypothetical protein
MLACIHAQHPWHKALPAYLAASCLVHISQAVLLAGTVCARALTGRGTLGSNPTTCCLQNHLTLTAARAVIDHGRYRLRESFDRPRRIHVSPEDPSFEGRLTSEINSCYGPR